MKTSYDLSDELRAEFPHFDAGTPYSNTVDLIVEAMQQAFIIGKGHGFREGNQVAEKVTDAERQEIRKQAVDHIVAAGRKYEAAAQREILKLRQRIQELEYARDDGDDCEDEIDDTEVLIASAVQGAVAAILAGRK